MTQEEKQLLLKDLCSRLPYGVMVDRLGVPHKVLSIKTDSIEIDRGEYIPAPYYLDEIKPYLRPISSMTEEEEKELSKKYVWNIWSGQIQIRYHSQGCWDDETECPTEEYIELFDWLNAHHFDYKGLIKKGLALEAPEGMYNTKIK